MPVDHVLGSWGQNQCVLVSVAWLSEVSFLRLESLSSSAVKGGVGLSGRLLEPALRTLLEGFFGESDPRLSRATAPRSRACHQRKSYWHGSKAKCLQGD